MKNVLARLIATLLVLAPTVAVAQTTTAWVLNKSSHSISIIDVETDEVLFNVKPMCCIPNTVCNPQVGNTPCILGPHDVDFTPDGQYAFVTAYDGDRLAAFDASPLPEDPPEYLGRLSIGDRPQGIVIDPEGIFGYVSISAENKVQIFEVSAGLPTTIYFEIEVMDDPNGIDITPDGAKVYVGNNGSGTVSVIDTDLLEVIETIAQVDAAPRRVVIGDIPGVGVRAYTCNATGDNVSVINADTDNFITEIMLDDDDTPQTSRPRGIALHPDQGTFPELYVTEYEAGEISIINTETNEVDVVVPHNDDDSPNPYRIAITPDGGKAYIVNMEITPGLVSVLNLDTNVFGDAVEVENQPGGIAMLELE